MRDKLKKDIENVMTTWEGLSDKDRIEVLKSSSFKKYQISIDADMGIVFVLVKKIEDFNTMQHNKISYLLPFDDTGYDLMKELFSFIGIEANYVQ